MHRQCPRIDRACSPVVNHAARPWAGRAEQPVHQWVLSFPCPYGALFATRPAVLSRVLWCVWRPAARSTRRAWVHVSGYRRSRLDSRKVGVALIEQHVRFVRRHRRRYPQHRCSSAVVPSAAECASRCEIVRSQRCAVEFVDSLLIETSGNRHSHAHESRWQRARLPVHQVLQYGEGIGLCRVYDPASGTDPSTAPPVSSTSVEWWIALVNDSVGVPGGFRPEDHADPVR